MNKKQVIIQSLGVIITIIYITLIIIKILTGYLCEYCNKLLDVLLEVME